MRDKEKQVQIPEKLFVDLVLYFLMEHDNEELFHSIASAIDKKLDSIVTRQIFTEFKTGATKEIREKAIREYLDRVKG